MALKTYRSLAVWKRGIDLVDQIYEATKLWPDSERFGLISQAQRAAVSVPANIAEGYGRTHRLEYLRHLSFARGSLMELETHIIIAQRRRYFPREQAKAIWSTCQEVGRMLNGQLRALRKDADGGADNGKDQPWKHGSTEPRTLNPDPSARSKQAPPADPR